MKVAEKTLELSLCAQLSSVFVPSGWAKMRLWEPVWFGLTQAQEARAGFDAGMRLPGGICILLQFKRGRRRTDGRIHFDAQHHQLIALTERVNSRRRCVYYVLPSVTNTNELNNGQIALLDSTWFLDVAEIPRLEAPSRKSEKHQFLLNPKDGVVEIRSNPVFVQARSGRSVASDLRAREGLVSFESFSEMWEIANLLGRKSVGAILGRNV